MRSLSIGAWRVAFAALVALLGTHACGPSLHYSQQAERSFERCYAIDFDAQQREAARACWRGWLERHGREELGDRTRYAVRRVRELGQPR